MPETIGEIKAAIASFRNDSTWLRLRSRWEQDFDLYRLKAYDAGAGYYSYTTNHARVFADKVISLMSNASLIIQVPLDVLTAEDRRIASNIERFQYGVLNINDERLALIPHMPNLRQQMAWYAALRGSFAIRAYVYKDDDSKTIPRIDVWDIYNVAFSEGHRGLSWVAHTRKATKAQIKEEYKNDKGEPLDIMGKPDADVIEFYTDIKYGVIVDDVWGIALEEHGLDYNPVSIITVGATPVVWQENYTHTALHVAESIFAPNRDLYPILDKTLSDHLSVVRRGIKPPMAHYTFDGRLIEDADIYQVEKGAQIPMRVGEKIEPIIPPTMPADTSALLEMIAGDIQRGSVPHTTYGTVSTRLSGFAINKLNEAVETVLQPCLTAMERAYKTAGLWVQGQYATGKFKPLALRGRTSRGEVFGVPKRTVIRASELKGDWTPEYKLEPTLPEDDAQKYYLANLAGQPDSTGIPLLSMQSRRELVGVKDPDLEEQKVNREWAATLQIPRLYEAYIDALNDGREDVAENILAELHRLLAAMGMKLPQGGQGKTLPTNQVEQVAGETEGAGMPPGKTGLPSSVMPSEQLGGLPGGALNAAMPTEAGEL